jgi:hypothetical protein
MLPHSEGIAYESLRRVGSIRANRPEQKNPDRSVPTASLARIELRPAFCVPGDARQIVLPILPGSLVCPSCLVRPYH